MKTQAGGYQTRELYHSKREFNHKTATERDKATVEKSLLALNWIRVSWFRAAAPLPLAQHPRAARRAVPPAPDSRAHFAAPRRYDRDAGNVAVGEIHAGKRCLKQPPE